ncbi:Leucine-rich repeat and coiled-coil domain-containing protein 1 [Fasciola gigantica]|uniref:Leucine-rich repeat and coiled-coil domain-containing protein 1 n=1 Tax=Fasciola gigantica TaxID=46835 RepID=A0A504Y8H7_FASGI|nr:Leucine-rich repeat and coiled-coil domain-containing protein 1 [Fasciola gigantica]
MNDSIEISVVDGGVESLGELDQTKLERAYSLNLHHNMIRCIEGLGSAINLRHIDLSSNFISKICGLERLSSLRTVNLSSNRIRRVEGLKYLKSLVRLDLSFNQLEDLEGLKELHGHDYRLTVVHLQGNRLTSLGHLVCCTVGLIYLKQLTVYDHEIEANNPLCHVPDYRRLVMNGLPQLEILDNLDWNDRPVRLDVLADLTELSRFLDYVSSSSLSEANETERQIQEACIRDFRSRTRSRPTRMLPLETSVVQTESHNVHVDVRVF